MAHNFRNALFSALALVTLVGCPPAETTDDPTDTPTVVEDPAIVGTWLSEGDDIADFLAGPPLNAVRIDAEFMADGSYLVTSTDGDGTEIDFVGTYTVDESTDPATIVLEQTSPTTATSEGIWQVDGGVLTYEVAQTVPEVAGVTPPTVEGGFGSTSGGAFGMMNVQIFR